MVSTFTPNLNFENQGRGDNVGTWDTALDNDFSLADLALGGNTTISLNNSNVTLSAAQFQCRQITFNSTLTGSVVITFPSTFKKDYLIEHACTGSSAFTITLQTTASGGLAICAIPGEAVQVFNDGTNLKYRNLGRIGSYMDYAGSSTPNWNDGCTIKPYLNCDGTSVSSNSYPVLFGLIGATLPDLRGRVRGYLNQGTGRMTTTGGVDGNTNLAAGGSQTVTLSSNNIPALTVTNGGLWVSEQSSNGTPANFLATAGVTAYQGNVSGTANTGSSNAPIAILPPIAIGGLTLIRSA